MCVSDTQKKKKKIPTHFQVGYQIQENETFFKKIYFGKQRIYIYILLKAEA